MLILVVASCASTGGPTRAQRAPRDDSTLRVELLTAFDLPREDPRSSELSGITWDDANRRLYAVSDSRPLIVPLVPDAEYRTWTMGDPIAVTVPGGWDGEGIAITPRGFYVSSEIGPHVYELDRSGALISDVPIPASFGRALHNRSLESLSLTPDGAFLFTANETALEGDGPQPTAAAGTMVRIFRRELATSQDAEFAYRTDPVFAPGTGGEMGVAEVCALSKSEVLVLERSYVRGVGNAVRLYRARLEGANVLGTGSIVDARPVAKSLVVDFGSMPAARIGAATHLPNYEGLALGPARPDGDRLLFVISDDNGLRELVTRILVLSLRRGT